MQENVTINHWVTAARAYGTIEAKSAQILNRASSSKIEDSLRLLLVEGRKSGISISGITNTSVINIYTLSGNLVTNEETDKISEFYTVSQGVYIVLIVSGRERKSFKVRVK